MDVAHLEPGAVAAEPAWPKGRKAALVGELGERVRLVHELAELAAPEKIADYGAQRLGVDQFLRGDLVHASIEQGHALADETLGAGETDPALVGQEFPYRAHPAAAKVIDVVGHPLAAAKPDKILHRRDKILLRKNPLILADLEAELLVDFVASDAAEVVALRVEEQALEHAAGILDGRRITWAQLAVDILQGLVLVMGGILLQGLDNRIVILRVNDLDGLVPEPDQLADRGGGERLEGAGDGDFPVADVGDQNFRADLVLFELLAELEVLDGVEKFDNVLVRRMAESAQEGRGQKFAPPLAAVQIHVEEVARVKLHLDPRSAIRDDPEAVEDFSVGVDGSLKTDAGRAVELGNDDTFRAVDHKCPLRGHQRQLAHVNFFLFGAPLVFVAERHVKRGAERLPLALGIEG